MADSNIRRSGAKIAGAIVVAVILLLIAAAGVYELAFSGEADRSAPNMLARSSPNNPSTEPANGWNQVPEPLRNAIGQAITKQIRSSGNLRGLMAWNLSAHSPGEPISPQWQRTLDGGVTVEMIAVGHPNENIAHWWDGDGKPVLMLPQWGQCVGRCAYVLRIAYPTPAAHDGPIFERTVGNSTSIFLADGAGKAELFCTAPAPGKGQPLRVEIGVGAGPWKPKDVPSNSVDVQPAPEGQPGQSLLAFSYTPAADEELGWAAVDKSGKTHWISSEGPITTRPPLPAAPSDAMVLTEHDNLRLSADSIDHIAVFTRPRVWTTFTGMADSPQSLQPATQPAVAMRPPTAQPATSPAAPQVNARRPDFANGNVTVQIGDIRIDSGPEEVADESQLRMAQFRLRQSASNAFGELESRRSLRGICDPPPNLLLVTGKSPAPGLRPNALAITPLRLDGRSWKYDAPFAESADRMAWRIRVLDSAAEDVEAGNFADASAMRAALLHRLDRSNASPATEPAAK